MIIVFVAYRIPFERLIAHFTWNDAGYRAAGVGVLAVVDTATFAQLEKARPKLPPYAIALEYPTELQQFSLAKTANFGLRRAGAAGGVAVKTDVDCYFAPGLLARLALAAPGCGAAPVYNMAGSLADALAGRARPWQASLGTLAMAAGDWAKLCGYNENMAGYGVEDGDLWDRALAAGINFDRPAKMLYHIAHDDDAEIRNKINPKNHVENRKLRGTKWQNPDWGIV